MYSEHVCSDTALSDPNSTKVCRGCSKRFAPGACAKKNYTITIIRRNFVIKIKVVVLGGLKPKEDETCILGFQDIYPHG